MQMLGAIKNETHTRDVIQLTSDNTSFVALVDGLFFEFKFPNLI